MNINQQELKKEEQVLLKKVLDFSFQIGKGSICFNDIVDKVELDLTVPSASDTEKISISILNEKKEKVQNEINKLEPILFRIMQSRLEGEDVKEPIYGGMPLGDYLGLLHGILSDLESIIQGGGKIDTPILGRFKSISKEKKVYLYLDNIQQAAKGVNREIVLITTFIHEMFHAWNYIACGEKERTDREIDEAMVEFATLYFLKQISQEYSDFEPVLKWAVQSIKEKQKSIGNVAAYGYGYYLFSLTNSNKSSLSLNLLNAYDKKSGRIMSSSCKDVKEKLKPFYPFNEEEQVFELFLKLLIHKYKASIENETIRATLQEYFDSKKSELDKFDDLIEGHRIVITMVKGQIKIEVTQKIDVSGR